MSNKSDKYNEYSDHELVDQGSKPLFESAQISYGPLLGVVARLWYKGRLAKWAFLTAFEHSDCLPLTPHPNPLFPQYSVMKSFVAIAAAALVAPAFAAPTALPITKLAGPTRSDSYIIKLKDGVSKDSHIARLLEAISGQDSKVVYKVCATVCLFSS